VADIFVSYTSSDRDWAHWIGVELRELGHTPFVHEWEIRGGDDIYTWMERRTEASDHMLCVLSEDYLKAPYSTLERNSALWEAAARTPRFMLPVVVKPCRLPRLFRHLSRCDLSGVSKDVASRRLKAFLEAPVAPSFAEFPGTPVTESNIPFRVPEHFLGRDDALEAIDAALKRDRGRVAITALHGLRGVGKTTLAAAYAERRRADYRATWWIRAQTPDTMRADLSALGVRLGWVAADEKEEPALQAVRERLRHEGEGLLLIYDNAIDVASTRPYLPSSGAARALVTSNSPAWRGVATTVEIQVWPKEVGADYLIARTGRENERAEAEALSEALGGLALANEQASACCERLGVSLGEYRRRFASEPARMLDAAKDVPAEYGLTVAKAFALAIDEAAKMHPAAESLITHAALLAPEPIPLFLFSEARETFGEPLASQLADDGLDEGLAALRAFALVDRETIPDERDPVITTETIRLHRLVRIAAAGRRRGEAAEEARRVLIEAMAAVYPTAVYSDPSAWPRARRLDALALDLVGSTGLPKSTETSAAYLSTCLGQYRHSALAAYGAARPLYERALAICEQALGPEDPATAASLVNLALLLKSQGDLAGARPRYERALAIDEKVYGSEHFEVATDLNNLANLLRAQGDLAGARPLYDRALAIREMALGPEHPDTAQSLNNLAGLLYEQGDLAGARPLYARADNPGDGAGPGTSRYRADPQ
jgi:tetratricopeptide (TPR) repeat protein